MTAVAQQQQGVTSSVDERLVLTLAIEGVDVGLLVAYEWGEGLFLEHVVLFPHAPIAALYALLIAGLDYARGRHAKYLGIYQPAQGMDGRLRQVADAFGFTETTRTARGTYLVRYEEA